MKLDRLTKAKLFKSSKRRGRGFGSGKGGHTVGRGTKGQKSRNKVAVGFEGGQVPLYKRLPRVGGFKNPTRKSIVSVSISRLNIFKDGSTVTPENLVEMKIIKRVPKHGVKLLGTGDLEKKLTVQGFYTSGAALEKIEKSGSKIA